MKSLKVQILQADIDCAKKGSSTKCLLARAICRSLKTHLRVDVFEHCFVVIRKRLRVESYLLSNEAVKLVQDFDDGVVIVPQEIEVLKVVRIFKFVAIKNGYVCADYRIEKREHQHTKNPKRVCHHYNLYFKNELIDKYTTPYQAKLAAEQHYNETTNS